MDKLTMAHEWFIAAANNGHEATIEKAWNYADRMQAEADKRENKSRPDVLKASNSRELEWQPDWSQAPDAKYWAMDKDGLYCFYKTEPEMVDNEYWDFGEVLFSSSSFGYEGDWKDSLRKRP